MVSTVVLFEMRIYGGPFYNIPVIVVIFGDDVICEVLLDSGCYFSAFYLADIDGDEYSEIMIRHETDSFGGMGQHQDFIYKLESGGLRKLFGFPADDYFSTGFTLALSDDWPYTVENQFTGFSHTFTRKTGEGYPYFDTQGKATEDAEAHAVEKWLGVDPYFFIFMPVDADGDGIFEIRAAQYTYLWSRADYIGTAYTILKWNPDDHAMHVIEANFETHDAEYE